MRSRTALAAVFFCLLTSPAFGQFYAPETEYHDPVQRVFPVEAARVLAWNANQQSNLVREITFSVSTSTNGSTSWQLSWLDGSGKQIRTAKVEYASTLLKQGAGFYRDVMRQLAELQPPNLTPLKPEDAVTGFWKGAERAGISREESLGRAFAIVTIGAEQREPLWMPQLAGLLAHAALPSIAARVSLDNQLLARSAVWLALSERSCSKELPALWTPVLFLSGRERSAVDTWKSAGQPPGPAASPNGVIAAWNLWSKRPTTKQTFLFAIDCDSKPMAMAMMVYDIQVNESGSLLSDLVMEPFAGSERGLAALHNYALIFPLRAGIGGGHVATPGAMSQRFAWVDLLGHCPAAVDVDGMILPAVRSATNALAKMPRPSEETDLSLVGLKEIAPLLVLGEKEGVGKLAPAPVATGRDLLNYGWEMAGLQLGSRHDFVSDYWGVPELAQSISNATLQTIPDFYPFFVNAEKPGQKRPDYPALMFRLQHVSRIYDLVGRGPAPSFNTYMGPNTDGPLFMKRCWLRPDLFNWQARCMWNRHTNSIGEIVESIKTDQGPLAAAVALRYLNIVAEANPGSRSPVRPEWRTDLVKMLPEPSLAYVDALWKLQFATKPPLEQAKQLERLYWQNPASGLEEKVFELYIKAGAPSAAMRFYKQARENFLDSVNVSNGIGRFAWITGYLKNDPELRRMALEDSASASGSDMTMHAWDAALHDNRRELEAMANQLTERYGSPMGKELKGFIPLLAALADPKHPQHKAALDYFGKSTNWVFIRLIWIEKFKLSDEDAQKFLGGFPAEGLRQVLMFYIRGMGKPSNYRTLVDQFVNPEDYGFTQPYEKVAAELLAQRVTAEKEPDVPDLKPPGAISARAAVVSRLKAKQK